MTRLKHLHHLRSLKNSALFVLAFILLINALAYGTILPLLYPYASRYGINPVGLSLLFASFSLAQFLATPVLGRLSDKFGRKPILLICIFGTSVSLALFASATSVGMLFFARIIDGVTGGNISVAQAMIADKTRGDERAKSFALLTASFGVGLLAGPALGGLMSNFGLTAPFWFASALALVGTILGTIILKETLPPSRRQSSRQSLFQFKTIYQALFSPFTGTVLLVGFLTSLAQNAFVIGVQSYTVDQLKMSPTMFGLMFSAVGVVSIIAQVVGIRLLLKVVHAKNLIVAVSLITSSVVMSLLIFSKTSFNFISLLVIYIILMSPVVPLITGLLSEHTKGEDQGGILGINQAYTSLGQIAGPLLAGLAAAFISVPSIFVVSALFLVAGFIATRRISVGASYKLDL